MSSPTSLLLGHLDDAKYFSRCTRTTGSKNCRFLSRIQYNATVTLEEIKILKDFRIDIFCIRHFRVLVVRLNSRIIVCAYPNSNKPLSLTLNALRLVCFCGDEVICYTEIVTVDILPNCKGWLYGAVHGFAGVFPAELVSPMAMHEVQDHVQYSSSRRGSLGERLVSTNKQKPAASKFLFEFSYFSL